MICPERKKKMEVTIEKADGSPLSRDEAVTLLNLLSKHFASEQDGDEAVPPLRHSKTPHDVEIMTEEDSACVYAVALCPGVPRDRIEVSVSGSELFIRTTPAETGDGEKADRPCLWKCIEEFSYTGECELPTEVIPEEASAELADGVLYIRLPKTEAVKPKIIAVS